MPSPLWARRGKPKSLGLLQSLLQGPRKTYRAGLAHSEEGGTRLGGWGCRDAVMNSFITWRYGASCVGHTPQKGAN